MSIENQNIQNVSTNNIYFKYRNKTGHKLSYINMLNEREMKYRLKCAEDEGVPITNYGTAIAYMNGILKRSLSVFPEISDLLK